MSLLRVIIGTNVLVAALKSKRGASHQIIRHIGEGIFETAVSVPLVLEYEDVCSRFVGINEYTIDDVDNIINYIVKASLHTRISFLWRPFLRDPKDDMLLEVAIAAQAQRIVTFNLRDFKGVDQFGITAILPGEFLQEIGGDLWKTTV